MSAMVIFGGGKQMPPGGECLGGAYVLHTRE